MKNLSTFPQLYHPPSQLSGCISELHLLCLFITPDMTLCFVVVCFHFLKFEVFFFSEGILVWSDHSGKVHSVTYSGCLCSNLHTQKEYRFFWILFNLQNSNWTKYNIHLTLISSEKWGSLFHLVLSEFLWEISDISCLIFSKKYK